jgi:hypothetical protein
VKNSLKRLVKESVGDALRDAEFTRSPEPLLPLPADVEAEQALLSLLLHGKAAPNPGIISHLFKPLHREVYVAMVAVQDLGLEVTVDRIVATMSASGLRVNGDVGEAVFWLKESPPVFESAESLQARILEKSRARRMVAWLQELEVDLRLGRESVTSTKYKMLDLLTKGSPLSKSPVSLASVKRTHSG